VIRRNPLRNPLIKDLEIPKQALDEFVGVTKTVLNYLPSVISGRHEVRGYTLLSCEVGESKKFVRPIRNDLFIYDVDGFQSESEKFIQILDKIKDGRKTIPLQRSRFSLLEIYNPRYFTIAILLILSSASLLHIHPHPLQFGGCAPYFLIAPV